MDKIAQELLKVAKELVARSDLERYKSKGWEFVDKYKGHRGFEALIYKGEGLTEDEVKIIEVFRHVHFGHITVHKKVGKLDGMIEFKETY